MLVTGNVKPDMEMLMIAHRDDMDIAKRKLGIKPMRKTPKPCEARIKRYVITSIAGIPQWQGYFITPNMRKL